MIDSRINSSDDKMTKSILNIENFDQNKINDNFHKLNEKEILTPQSISNSDNENCEINSSEIQSNENKNIENCNNNYFNEKNDENDLNELLFESEETEESESESEISTEDEDSSDENDPDIINNSIMQERWKELDKYGSTSDLMQPNDGLNNNPNIYRLTAPINLSSTSSAINHHLSENLTVANDYCLNNSPIHDDTFLVGMNGNVANNALNMSMRHMSSMKPIPPIKNNHLLHSMENDSHYHMLSQKSYKPDSIHCRIPHPHPNSNINLNNSSLNYDYNKQSRHILNPHHFNVNDMRSQFHINMMMNGHDTDSLSMPPISHSHIQDFRCNYCNKCYTNQSSLRSHLKKHMNIDEKKYKCEKCSYSSQYQKNLLKHIHINHEELSDSQHCRCDICDRMFSSEFLLKDHLRMHTSDNTYQCNQCGKKLKTKLKLRYHADVHNPEKPYICDVDGCDRSFRTPKYLKNHKDEFHKLQPKKHFCPVDNCKLVFQRKSHLKRHMSMHDGEKNYHCHWPDCNRSFRSQETLNVHLIRHTGEKPFKCELCEYSCRQKASLNYHCRNAHAKDCERLLGLKPFVNDGRPPGVRPVGRPPRNRVDNVVLNPNKHTFSKFEALDENDNKLESQIESDVNGIISHLDKDTSIVDVFKKPAPVDENDFLRKEVFMIVDDVLGNPPRDYCNVEEFSLEELCLIELSIKSKRGRKRKVLKELDALLAQSLNDNQILYDEEEDDSGSYKDSIQNIDNDDDVIEQSSLNISRSKYMPSIMQSPSAVNNNSSCISNKNNLGPQINYSDLSSDRLTPELHHTSPTITPDNHNINPLINNSPLKLVTNRMTSFPSLNNYPGHTNCISSFDANYILGNNNNPCADDDQSLSHSNSPMSGEIKIEPDDNGSLDDESRNNSPSNQLPWLVTQSDNLSCQKVTPLSTTKVECTNDMGIASERNLPKVTNLQKHFENSVENLKMNKDLLDQVLEDLKVIQNDEEHKPRPFLSPTSTALFSNSINSFKNIIELNGNNDIGTKSLQKSLPIRTPIKMENNNQPKSLDSSLWSDSGYSSGHDSSGISKENATINNLNHIGSTLSLPSLCDRNYKIPSPSSNAAASFIEKTAAAAEIAALSASAALLNSDFYSSYQQNMENNRAAGESSYSPYESSGFNTQLTSMSNICSNMYKSGLEDHIRSLTALGSKYMENNVYPGSNRSDSNPGPEINGVDALSNLWSSSSASTGEYLTSNSLCPSNSTSLNPFDPANMRNGIGDYYNLAQSPKVAAAADFYSQMTASANYDKYSSLYGCRDSFYDSSTSANRGISALNNGSNNYGERSYLSSSHPFYPQSTSGQYGGRYPPSGASAADYLSMGRQFSSGGSSGNPFSIGNDPYRNSVLHNMSPFNRYPF